MNINEVLFPTLLVCGFLGIMILVGVVFSYIWLVYLDRRFRRCPQCGKSGSGNLVATEVLDSRSRIEWRNAGRFMEKGVDRRQQLRVTEQVHEDTFECEQCGHRWTQTITEKEQKPVGR